MEDSDWKKAKVKILPEEDLFSAYSFTSNDKNNLFAQMPFEAREELFQKVEAHFQLYSQRKVEVLETPIDLLG